MRFSTSQLSSYIYHSSVQFNEEVEVKTVDGISGGNNRQEDVVEISENRIDEVLSMLHEADPTSPGKNFNLKFPTIRQ
jgi:hypothetical protein